MIEALRLMDEEKKTAAEASRIVGNITPGAISKALKKIRERQHAAKPS